MANKITFDMCRKMTDALVVKGKEMGKSLAIVVADASGCVISAALMDGYHPRGIEFASRKAYTAVKMSRTGKEFRALCERDHVTVDDFGDPKLTIFIGSTPIRDAEGDVIGAVAVSGATSEEDQELSDFAAGLLA